VSWTSRVSETLAAASDSTGKTKLDYTVAVVGWLTPRLSVSRSEPQGVHNAVIDMGPGEVALSERDPVARQAAISSPRPRNGSGPFPWRYPLSRFAAGTSR